MKITKQYLKQIIKEELQRTINESPIPTKAGTFSGQFSLGRELKNLKPGMYLWLPAWNDPDKIGVYSYQGASVGAKQHLGDFSKEELQAAGVHI